MVEKNLQFIHKTNAMDKIIISVEDMLDFIIPSSH